MKAAAGQPNLTLHGGVFGPTVSEELPAGLILEPRLNRCGGQLRTQCLTLALPSD